MQISQIYPPNRLLLVSAAYVFLAFLITTYILGQWFPTPGCHSNQGHFDVLEGRQDFHKAQKSYFFMVMDKKGLETLL